MDDQRAAKKSRERSLRRLSVYAGASLGAVILLVVVLAFVFRGTILNRYGKEKAQRAFAQAHPGCALRIGELDYAVGANCLVAQWVTLSATNTTLKVGRISLTGVRWTRLLWRTVSLADVLAKASLDATNLDVEFPQAHYGIHCARLGASVPGSELIAEGTELWPLDSTSEPGDPGGDCRKVQRLIGPNPDENRVRHGLAFFEHPHPPAYRPPRVDQQV
jgi:hypothetical protein